MNRERLESISFAVLRIIAGAMVAIHGIDHLASGAFGHPIGAQMWIGGFIELVCGTCVAAGFFARLTAFLLAGQFAVAYFQFHWKLQFTEWGFLPMVNHGELAVVYCFLFLMIWARGPGEYSLDRRARRA